MLNEDIIFLSWRLDYWNWTLVSESIVDLRLLNSLLCLRRLHYTQRIVGVVNLLLFDCGRGKLTWGHCEQILKLLNIVFFTTWLSHPNLVFQVNLIFLPTLARWCLCLVGALWKSSHHTDGLGRFWWVAWLIWRGAKATSHHHRLALLHLVCKKLLLLLLLQKLVLLELHLLGHAHLHQRLWH